MSVRVRVRSSASSPRTVASVSGAVNVLQECVSDHLNLNHVQLPAKFPENYKHSSSVFKIMPTDNKK